MEDKKEPFSFPKMEERILEFWEKNKIFEKSVALRKVSLEKARDKQGKKHFVFYEGPPYANGKPGMHHVEARAFKDVVARYKTMRGYFVPRRAGWDTHGLPTEMAAEKKLGIKSKREIEERVGIETFVEAAREDVFLYKGEWEKMTRRMGYWLDMEHPYVTMTNDYIESLWAIIKKIAERGFLYQADKILPWCIRCGTALSSHELAQGYKKTKDNSIYIRMGDFLVWTTTPWTLPGNVALAVNPKVEYVKIEMPELGRPTSKGTSDVFIVAKSRAEALFPNAKIIATTNGSDLVGKTYEPLYEIAMSPEDRARSYRVVAGDFVSTEEGTGVVHIAPAFGEDDMTVGNENNLPILRTANDEGCYEEMVKGWEGILIWDANPKIVEDLRARKLLVREELYEHDYPFCWRCDQPLMYLAKESWWIKMSALRDKLIAANETITWYPSYIKEGRFGEWLKEVRDWAFSRERYWGTPLPVWQCAECKEWETIGAIAEIKERAVRSRNRYIIMRHGEAENNVKNIINSSLDNNHFGLTEKGKQQIEKSVSMLKKQNAIPNVVIASPFLRTQETARMVADAFDMTPQTITTDQRLGEINTGSFNGKRDTDYHTFYNNQLAERFVKAPTGGEHVRDVAKRVWSLLKELEEKYQDKTILLVAHEYTCWSLWLVAHAATNEEAVVEKTKRGDNFLKTAEFEMLDIASFPRDAWGNLDLHKPYIDAVLLQCKKCNGIMVRVPEVVDVWFDSGAMPFASEHWPFSGDRIPYPADYICEAIDQTRGWFYTLLAVATLLERPAPYRNVISLGLLLDENGKKMSKSRGNIVDPWKLFDAYGADSMRWYFFTINQPWDEKLFSEKDVADSSRRFFMILWNCFQFFHVYGKIENSDLAQGERRSYKLIINQWIMARLDSLINDVTTKMDSYDIVGAARAIEQFVVEDFSRWYVRRIRGIMRENSAESQETSVVLRYVLLQTTKLLAPFAPFIAETLYRELDGEKESIHWEDFPAIHDVNTENQKLLESMNEVRNVVALSLEARAKAGIKVRQPLQTLKMKALAFIPTSVGIVVQATKEQKLKNADSSLLDLIKDEVNVKEIIFDNSLDGEVQLDTAITPELKEEGMLRDLIREIQQKRKEAGLKPNDQIKLLIKAPTEMLLMIKKYENQLMAAVNAKTINTEESTTLEILFD